MATRTRVVVMAGGRGERLWPLVRRDRPKACVSFEGSCSLIEATLRRLKPLTGQQAVQIITDHTHATPIRRILGRRFRYELLGEPQPKNTAACVALAAVLAAKQDSSTVLVVVPADHWIKSETGFRKSLSAAIAVARAHDAIVTVGLKPTRVHTGMGHLCLGSRATSVGGCRVFRLRRFIEKPSAARAQRLMRMPMFWNAGIFVGRAEVFVKTIQRWLPRHLQHLAPVAAHAGRSSFASALAKAYRSLPNISFDHGVMAHERRGYVVEGTFAWDDLGSWESWARLARSSAAVQIQSRNVRVLGANGPACRACGAGRHLVAVAGVRDLVIVHTPDATLVCHPSASQAVREIVAKLVRDAQLSRYR